MYDNIKRREKLMMAGIEMRAEENATQKVKSKHIVYDFLESNSEL
jgi:hypothetical protein